MIFWFQVLPFLQEKDINNRGRTRAKIHNGKTQNNKQLSTVQSPIRCKSKKNWWYFQSKRQNIM